MKPPGDGFPVLSEEAVEPLSLDFVRSVDSGTTISGPVLRYVASASGDVGALGPSAPDWDAVLREWALDDDVLRGGPLAQALVDLERAASEREGRSARHIIRRVGGVAPHPEARTEADVTVGPDTPVADSSGVSEDVAPIYLSKADTGPLEEEWVLKAMRSGYVAPLGPMVDEFERRIAERVGVSHALALSSGTAALHLLLLGVGARAGTYVIVPTMTFAATVNAVMYTGATPFFVDVQESDANIDVDLTLQAVDQLQAEGKEVAAVLAVDLYGRCADYTRLEPELAVRGVTLLEDAAEALGATHAGRAAGSFGHGAILSFNGNKIMTTSGGGMLLSNDGDLVDRARYLSTQARQPLPWYEHTEVGYNYRLSNILAGIGLAQLSRLDDMIARRRQIRDYYCSLLPLPPQVRVFGRGPDAFDQYDNCWLTSVALRDERDFAAHGIISSLADKGIEARHLWKPLHLQRAFDSSPRLIGGVSEDLFRRGLNLPTSVSMKEETVGRVAAAFTDALRIVSPDESSSSPEPTAELAQPPADVSPKGS